MRRRGFEVRRSDAGEKELADSTIEVRRYGHEGTADQ